MTNFQDSHTDRAADIEAIKQVRRQLVESWNRGDGMGYGTCFTDDADYVDVTGTHTQGREMVAKMHAFLFNGPLKGSQLDPIVDNDLAVSFLAPEVALVIARGGSRLADQKQSPSDRDSIYTTVFVKRDGAWKIRAFQNNRVQPQSAGPFQRPPQ